MRRQNLVLSTAVCAGLAVAMAVVDMLHPSSASADTGPWTEPIKVSGMQPKGFHWFPDVAADDAGNVHILWNSTDETEPGEDQGKLFYLRWDGQSWTKETDLALIWHGHALRSALAVDRSGRLHLTYRGYGNLERDYAPGSMGPEDVWYTTASGEGADRVGAWRAPTRITRGRLGYFSDIVIDSHNRIHLIWTESDATGKYGLYYTRSSDGGTTWSERVALEEEHRVWWYRAQLKVDPQDRLHVVWELINKDLGADSLGFGTSAGAVYALSTDGGATWSKTPFPGKVTSRRASPAAGGLPPGPQQPAVAVDGLGTIMLVYRDPDTNRVLYQQSMDGVRWTAPAPIPGVMTGEARPFDTYDMVTDSAGHIHVAMVAYPSSTNRMALLHTEWDGRSWSNPTVLASAPPYPEYPKFAISSGNRLHLVWFEGDRRFDRTPIAVRYSTALTSAPEKLAEPIWAPVFEDLLATPIPTVSPAMPVMEVVPPQVLPLEADPSEDAPEWLAALRRQPSFPLVVAAIPVTLLLLATLITRLGLVGSLVERLQERNLRNG